MRRIAAFMIAYILSAVLVGAAAAHSFNTLTAQSADLAAQEAQVIYETNQVRAQNGLAPLRANVQLTDATRWFALDKSLNPSVVNCTAGTAHLDSLGRTPGDRAVVFGYPGLGGAENVWCNWVDPVYAVQGWMESAGHAGNILNPEHREIGVGYSAANGGWLAQDFGRDENFAPLIINNEALNTAAQAVSLYKYDTPWKHFFQTLRPIKDIQISEDECMFDAAWQSYTSPNLNYTLSGGQGWKTVYVRSRDGYGYTTLTSDSIYLGSSAPQNEINAAQMADSASSVTLYQLDSGGRGYAQFSLGWVADQFMDRNNAALTQTSDSAALDGRAVTISGSSGFAWDWTSTFHSNTPMVAYFRLKVADKTAAGTLATLDVTAGANTQSRTLTGANFSAANTYTEIAVPFTYTPTDANPFLIFTVRSSGATAITVDLVSIFTAPVAVNGSAYNWTPPGGVYRGQGVWVRYSNSSGGNYTAFSNAVTAQPGFSSAVSALELWQAAGPSGQLVQRILNISTRCGSNFTWTPVSSQSWLQVSAVNGRLVVQAAPGALPSGDYSATITLQTSPNVGSLQIPVNLHVRDSIATQFFPVISR
jgi:uncharacterized protein YkwD